ncbi:MAG: helix-turn-helix domain-containing protein [Shewanella sp.]|uniref:helix-turn-helix domain-containing protein n=1 Tax=Aeromonas popoffii TaxID=70856 RepID=UPI003F2EB8B8
MSAKYTFWAWEVDIKKAPLKLALLQLANNSNDDGVSWYSVPKMAKRCGMSERALQGHIKTLEGLGLLVIKDRPGTSRLYTLQYSEVVLNCRTPAESAPHPRRICTAPPQNLHHTPAESADDLKSIPNIESNTCLSPCGEPKRASKTKGSRLSDDWIFPQEWIDWAVSEKSVSKESANNEAERFGDYWKSVAGAKGVKANWLSTWKNWVRSAIDRNPKIVNKQKSIRAFGE